MERTIQYLECILTRFAAAESGVEGNQIINDMENDLLELRRRRAAGDKMSELAWREFCGKPSSEGPFENSEAAPGPVTSVPVTEDHQVTLSTAPIEKKDNEAE